MKVIVAFILKIINLSTRIAQYNRNLRNYQNKVRIRYSPYTLKSFILSKFLANPKKMETQK
jgi:hypothetical protein